MKIYINCKEDEYSSDRSISEFTLNGKCYKLDYGISGSVCMKEEAYGCLQFICKIGKKQFHICCEEKVIGGSVERKYFILKD